MIAVVAMIVAFLLLTNKHLPAMLVLLLMGVVVSLILDPGLINELKGVSVRFSLPSLVFGKVTWQDIGLGALVLGIPQVPLTPGQCRIGHRGREQPAFS